MLIAQKLKLKNTSKTYFFCTSKIIKENNNLIVILIEINFFFYTRQLDTKCNINIKSIISTF